MKLANLINGTMALILGSALAAGAALVASVPAAADSHGMGKSVSYAGHHGGHHGKGGHGAHGGGQGKGKGKGQLFGPNWKTTLSPEQQAALDRRHVAYAKAKMPLKAQAKAMKAELAVLAVADEPDSAAINAKIDELLALKRTMMINKYEYVAAQRKLLTPEQRVSFDMDVIKRSKHGQKGKRRH